MTLLQRFLPEQLVPHSLEVSGRCLGVCRRLDDIAPEIPSGATGPPLPGGVWEVSGSVQTSG